MSVYLVATTKTPIARRRDMEFRARNFKGTVLRRSKWDLQQEGIDLASAVEAPFVAGPICDLLLERVNRVLLFQTLWASVIADVT